MTEREHKYVVTAETARRFLARCNGNLAPTVYDRERPIAYARTLYLDTPDRAFHRAADTPWSCRIRVREYASARSLDDAPRLTGTSTLELKQSDGETRRKWREHERPSALRERLERGARVDELPFPVPPLCRTAVRLVPHLTTWYRRLSFAATGVRITVDESVSFCAPELPGEAGELAEPDRVVQRGPSAVLEIKLTAPPPPWLVEATAAAGSRARFSKFREGMNIVFGAGPRSRSTLSMPTLDPSPGTLGVPHTQTPLRRMPKRRLLSAMRRT